MKMIEVNGYKAFHGVMKITPLLPGISPFKAFEVEDDWLYKPESGRWYCKGGVYSENACQVISETPKTCKHNYIEKQVEKGVTVQALECADCGDISVGWYRED